MKMNSKMSFITETSLFYLGNGVQLQYLGCTMYHVPSTFYDYVDILMVSVVNIEGREPARFRAEPQCSAHMARVSTCAPNPRLDFLWGLTIGIFFPHRTAFFGFFAQPVRKRPCGTKKPPTNAKNPRITAAQPFSPHGIQGEYYFY